MKISYKCGSLLAKFVIKLKTGVVLFINYGQKIVNTKE